MDDGQPLALSVEKVRHEMLRGILVPRELVNDSLRVVAQKLRAKETKFFSFKGRVLDQVEVENHAIQLQAADQIFSLAGLYAREREDQNSTPGVALEVDPTTGVVRIIVGSPISLNEAQTPELPPVPPSPAEASVVKIVSVTPQEAVKARAVVPDSAWHFLAEEIVE